MRIIWVMAMAVGLAGTASAAPDPRLVEDLVAANRVLADLGVVDGFGHVSVRSDDDPSHYFMSRSLAPALVRPEDILEYDLDSNAVDAKGQALFLERFIHGEIYKARPDVKAVVHCHAPSLIPFGATTVKLQPIYHMSSFLGAGVPVFEIREVAGHGSDLLIRNGALGATLAKVLGDKAVALMRGHGAVVVGNAIPQVVFRAYYTEMNARLQAEAMRLGAVTYLSTEEAAAAARTNDGVLARAWDLWKRKAKKTE